MVVLSAIIHFPMVLQRTHATNEKGDYVMVNNVDLLCSEPIWTIYSYYKLGREFSRFFIVVLMSALNVVIARQLQLTKQRRRRLVRRSSPQHEQVSGLNTNSESSISTFSASTKKEESSLIRSFTEKKLTILMGTICVIFLLGNVPQIIVMILQNEAMEHNYRFQLYRHLSNTLEVLHHCLNFYVFCIASTEYTRCFLLNCLCLQNVLYRFPTIARFMARRRSSSVMVNSVGFGVPNKEYLSMESIQEEAKQWVVDPTSSPYAQAETNLKGILVTGNRESRQKKSLTIVNHRAVEVEADSENEMEIL
uniref:G_PROTEIN_RECEP_F1_2 domain-containing protein n=2 Tax=Caenorhabditis japonica TaxID=281687 RepID=A0A8R1I0K1_CAEJA